MNGFEKWQVIVLVIQSGVLIMAFIGALYFGFKQKEVNDTLAQIESYNYEQTKIQHDYKTVQETRDLRQITRKIMKFFTWGTSEEKKAIDRRTHEEKLIIANKIYALLDDGLDNVFLISNKKALYEWLNASDQISAIIQNPTGYYNMEKESGSKVIMGPIAADVFEAWKESNKKWTITAMSQEEIEAYNTKQLQKILQSVGVVYGELDLGFIQLKKKLKKELSQNTKDK